MSMQVVQPWEGHEAVSRAVMLNHFGNGRHTAAGHVFAGGTVQQRLGGRVACHGVALVVLARVDVLEGDGVRAHPSERVVPGACKGGEGEIKRVCGPNPSLCASQAAWRQRSSSLKLNPRLGAFRRLFT